MLENVVLFAARALRAFKARDKQEGDTHGHEYRYQIRIRRKPMNQCTHNSGENTAQTPQNRQFLSRPAPFGSLPPLRQGDFNINLDAETCEECLA
jgi:hypothetical protein